MTFQHAGKLVDAIYKVCVGDDGLAVGSPCLRRLELRTIGQVELEVVVVHLCLRWGRRVVDREQTLAVQLSAVGFEAEHVGGHAEVSDFLRDVIYLYLD